MAIELDPYGEDGLIEHRREFHDLPRRGRWPIYKPAGPGGYNLAGGRCETRDELRREVP